MPVRKPTSTTLRELAGIGWLSQQPPEFQDRMAGIGRWVRVACGTPLYVVGEAPKAMFGLAEGRLDVSIPIGPDDEVVVHRAPPGLWIGDGALLSGMPRVLSVRAAADCRLFRIPRGALARVLGEHPGDWMYLHRLSTINGTLCAQILAEVLALPARARFARLLLRIAAPDGAVLATQEELGAMAGMSRAAFRRALHVLIEAGALETGRGSVRIHDRAALEREAELRAD
jgi:CRP/FNR family transcriptional regulator, cyclic AMP receptor protein